VHSLPTMSIDITQLKESLLPIRACLGEDEVIQRIRDRLNDRAITDQLAASRAFEEGTLAWDTIGVESGYQLATEVFVSMGLTQWNDKWQVLHKDFAAVTKLGLATVRLGIGYYTDFNNKVVKQTDWIKENFEEAISLVAGFADSPVGDQMVTDSAKVSQGYTDNRRSITEFVEEMGESGIYSSADTNVVEAIGEYRAEMTRLIEELAKCRMEVNQIESTVNETLGFPGWITWTFTGILQSVGYGSLEDARQKLASLCKEQYRLRLISAIVKEKAMRLPGSDRFTTLPIAMLAIMMSIDNLILSASDWARYRHDIILISEGMKNASDSASQKSLIMRIEALGKSLDALLPLLDEYLMYVGGTGWYD